MFIFHRDLRTAIESSGFTPIPFNTPDASECVAFVADMSRQTEKQILAELMLCFPVNDYSAAYMSAKCAELIRGYRTSDVTMSYRVFYWPNVAWEE